MVYMYRCPPDLALPLSPSRSPADDSPSQASIYIYIYIDIYTHMYIYILIRERKEMTTYIYIYTYAVHIHVNLGVGRKSVSLVVRTLFRFLVCVGERHVLLATMTRSVTNWQYLQMYCAYVVLTVYIINCVCMHTSMYIYMCMYK